ncbi:MAG: hypothetical protein V1773_18040 [bacterium]
MKKHDGFRDFLGFVLQTSEKKTNYEKLNLKFNPFPKSGTANINDSDDLILELDPPSEVLNKIGQYINDAMNTNEKNGSDKFLASTIIGDYGSGKTQLLLFVKALLKTIASNNILVGKKPYVIYIDNPGTTIMELISSIILKIGEEDLKKFIWAKIIKKIDGDDLFKQSLTPFLTEINFNGVDPFDNKNTVSYKQFIDAFSSKITNPREKNNFFITMKSILLPILKLHSDDEVLAQFFYEFLSTDYGVNKTWDALRSGTVKQFNGKEVFIIRYIIDILKEQGYTDFFILVDEFEDITKGRLTKDKIDNYLSNLRTLLDKHREWCLLFAMTGEALRRLEIISPPLANRITTIKINLEALDEKRACEIIKKYLELARIKDVENFSPFEVGGIKKILNISNGINRLFLKNCYRLIEEASRTGQSIDDHFVEYISREN